MQKTSNPAGNGQKFRRYCWRNRRISIVAPNRFALLHQINCLHTAHNLLKLWINNPLGVADFQPLSRARMPAKVFVDTNIWLYALIPQQESPKHLLAAQFVLAMERPLVNSQVIREASNNLLRKAGIAEVRLREMIQDWYRECEIYPSSVAQYLFASEPSPVPWRNKPPYRRLKRRWFSSSWWRAMNSGKTSRCRCWKRCGASFARWSN